MVHMHLQMSGRVFGGFLGVPTVTTNALDLLSHINKQ